MLWMIGGTGVGDAGANAFPARFCAPMPLGDFGNKVVSVLEDPEFDNGLAFGLNEEKGVIVPKGDQP